MLQTHSFPDTARCPDRSQCTDSCKSWKTNIFQLIFLRTFLVACVPVCYIVHRRPPYVSGGAVVANQEILKVVCETTVLELGPPTPAK